jgi:DNA invertase Pin-like site-specific DNA recombinase
MRQKLMAYYRVSTAKQGASGLGLEGQEAAVGEYARATGGNLLRAYTEVETGKRSDRPELARALADCKRSKAVLIIAKLDRLARNVHFLSGLMEAGVEFVCCDMPSANRLTLHIMAAVAEDEAKRISERTKAALAAYKARGGVLGAARHGAYRLKGGANAKAARRAGEVARERAADAYADLAPAIAAMRADGLSLRQIAGRINAEGHTTRRGKQWNQVQIKRIVSLYQRRVLRDDM